MSTMPPQAARLMSGPAVHNPEGQARVEFAAMGTTVTMLLPIEHVQHGSQIVRALFDEWERELSRFLPESGLSKLNQHAGDWVVVSELLFDVLDVALQAASATDGVFDPALLPQLKQIGYDRTFEEVPVESPALCGTPLSGGAWRRIQIEHEHHVVYVPPGVALDFGGIAKGMAVDAACVCLRDAGIAPALVSAGGDMAVIGTPSGQDGWIVEIPGVHDSRQISLERGALATSSVARRAWRQGDERRHHLIDPRTGLPAQQGSWSATVATDRCVQAEVAAKVSLILGAKAGRDFLDWRGLAGLLILEDGSWLASRAWPAGEKDAS